jgi:hypothetical protein
MHRTAVLTTLSVALAVAGTAHAAGPAPGAAERALAAATAAAQAGPSVEARTAPGDVRAQALVGTPGTLFDAIADGDLAPDLQAMSVAATDDGRLSVLIRLNTNLLVSGDSVFTWVDADGNPATGSAAFGGADVAVGILGDTYGDDSLGMLRWDGSSWVTASGASLQGLRGGSTDEYWTASLAELGIAPGTTVAVRFGAMYSGVYSTYFDWAPEIGGAPLTYTVPAPAPPAPAPAPTGGTATPAPGGGVVVTATPALRVNGLSASRSGRTLTVRTRWQGDRARATRYRLELRARGTTRTLTGAAPAGRALVRRVRLPLAWSGRTVQVRVTLTNGSHRVTATRVVRG